MEFLGRVHRFAVRHWSQGALIVLAWGMALWLPACASSGGGRGGSARAGETPMIASWYGKEQHHKLTASGQTYDMYEFTAANRSLPLGTILQVRNPANGDSVRVTVNDRGPYVHGRDLDVSYAAARDLGLLTCGVAKLYAKPVGHDSRYDKYWKHGVPPLLAASESAPDTAAKPGSERAEKPQVR